MKVLACVILVGLFVDIATAVKSKQVNLALETVLNFDKNDRKADLAVIDKVQNFLEQIKNGMRRSSRRSSKSQLNFSDFVLKAAKILREYSDDKLEDAYVIINDESKSYVNKESQFNDLFESQDMRRFVTDKLDGFKEMPALILRRVLDAAIDTVEQNKKTGEKNDFLDVGNSLYDGAGPRLKKALKNLDKMRRLSEMRLEHVLKNTLRSLVFDHYTSLNTKVREELINMVKHYWRAFSSKDDDKKALRQSEIKEVTPFKHEKRSRYSNRHKDNPPKEKTHSSKKSIEDNNSDMSTKKDRDVKIDRDEDKREILITNSELQKLIKREPRGKTKHQNRFNIYLSKQSYRSPKVKRGRTNQVQSPKRYSPDKQDQDKHGKSKEFSEYDEQDVLMGGQVIRDPVNFRDEPPNRQTEYKDDGRTEDDSSSTEEIIIQHNNMVDIGLMRKSPGRLNITFLSSDTVEAQNVSNETTMEKKSFRKSNVNDTTAKDPENVNSLIENIEKQIAQVRDQVEYVKNLAQTKSNDSNEQKASKRSDDDALSKKDSTFAFRALEDSDFYNSSEQNDTKHDTDKLGNETTTANAVRETTLGLKSDKLNEKSVEMEPNVTKTNDAVDVTQPYQNKNIYLKDMDQENAITESNANSTSTTTEIPLFKD